jgi:hypothetical protein
MKFHASEHEWATLQPALGPSLLGIPQLIGSDGGTEEEGGILSWRAADKSAAWIEPNHFRMIT